MFAWSLRIISGLDSQSEFQTFTLFPAAILVLQGGTPTWRLHTGFCKCVQNISRNIWSLGKRTDLKLGEVYHSFISYNIINSWLYMTLYIEWFSNYYLNCVTVQPKELYYSRMTKFILWRNYTIHFRLFAPDSLCSYGRRGGVMASTLLSRSSRLGSSPGRGHYVVLVGQEM